MGSDTRIWSRHEEPTHRLDLVAGQRLRIITGPLLGQKGTFVARQQGGVLLIRVDNGMYVEVSEFCVKPEGAKASEPAT